MAIKTAFGVMTHGAGYSRPEPFGAWEAGFVRGKRELRASWDDIAKMLGRSTEDVRRRFDAEWREPARVVFRVAPVDLGLRAQQEKALRGLLDRRVLTREALAALLYGSRCETASGSTLNAVVSLLRANLAKKGVEGIKAVEGTGWRLTAEARDRLGQLGWVSIRG